ncbi:sulfotransferase family 2 domain-containing protein [Metabacillus arenae]|uniref:Sulfotransferase family 2 domain-containing protein n=1 Tax=Metabacillus arenae TaxID=2771434 RepID=A0A926NJV2_9BACI|nr:sulfotransferase family 2 domain-containing protein [Metabacillus arenae]MBD1381913.1 sulfotransferase family 2 domain-containing protein [Metabacillus arenae]
MLEEKVAIFVHIPKTAGSTLRRILKKQYDPSEICFANKEEMKEKLTNFSKEELEKLKCINGHICFGIHEYLSNRPYVYYTMLRDPVEQVISEYYYILRKPNNMAHNKVKNMSFEEFIYSDEFKGHTSNRQTCFISGEPKKDLSKAKENLMKHFSIVGITEMFEESVFLINQELGWKNFSLKKNINVTKNRPTRDDIPEHVIETLKKNNELDIELYHFGKELLEKKIQNLSSKSRKEMNHFVKQQRIKNRKFKN